MSSFEKDCPVTFTMKVIGGKWKPIVLFNISKENNRFGSLLKNIDGISKQMLTKQLRELENDGIINRVVFPEIPPRVEYEITEKGFGLLSVIESMKDWGENQLRI